MQIRWNPLGKVKVWHSRPSQSPKHGLDSKTRQFQVSLDGASPHPRSELRKRLLWCCARTTVHSPFRPAGDLLERAVTERIRLIVP